MEVIVPDYHIYGRMELDATRLGTGQISFIVYMMDMIIFNYGKYTSQVSYNTGLAAVMYVAVPYDMRTDRLLAPSLKLGDKGAVPLGLGSVLVFVLKPLIVIALLPVLAKRYSRAF